MNNHDRYSRADLAYGLAHLEGISESQAKRIIDHLVHQIIYALLEGKTVYLPRLCSIKMVPNETKRGVHPLTLEPLVIEPTLKVRFKASTTLVKAAKSYAGVFIERMMDGFSSKEKQEYEERKLAVISEVNSLRSEAGLDEK